MTYGVRMAPGSSSGRWSSKTRLIRRGTGTTYRKLQSLKFLLTRDHRAVARFLLARYPFEFPRRARLAMLQDFLRVTHGVRGYHSLAEILTVSDAIFRRADGRPLTVLEAGAGSGSSTAKLSIAVRHVGGRLLVFDSFQGIPTNDEQHHLLDGRPLQFRKGAFKGRLAAVKKRVAEFGAAEVCTFTKGLFETTLVGFEQSVDVALFDVDLISSTRACALHVLPNLSPDGIAFSQDGHLRATVDLFEDEAFWRNDVGIEPPAIDGLGVNKLLVISASRRLT